MKKRILLIILLVPIMVGGCDYLDSGAIEQNQWIGNAENPYQGIVSDHFYSSVPYGFRVETGQGVLLRSNTSQTIQGNKYRQIVFHDSIYNTGAFAISANNSELTCLYSGLYAINTSVEIFGGYEQSIFYPDAHAETSSVDGYVSRLTTWPAGENWATIKAGAGTASSDTGLDVYTLIDSVTTASNWYTLRRGVLLFDTSNIAGKSVIDAKLDLYGKSKIDGLNITPEICIYTSNPSNDTFLVASDYGTFGSVPLANSITYSGFNVTGNNTFVFNTAGLAVINVIGGKTKLGTREAKYDAGSSSPAWLSDKQSGFYYYSADKGTIYRPKLTVGYGQETGHEKLLIIKINGNIVGLVKSYNDLASCNTMFYLNVGDILSVEFYCSASSMTINSTDYYSAYLSASRVGK